MIVIYDIHNTWNTVYCQESISQEIHQPSITKQEVSIGSSNDLLTHFGLWCHWVFNIGSGNGLLPSDTKSLHVASQISNVRHTESKKLDVSRLVLHSCSCLCPIHWSQVLSWEWRCSWSSTDRWFSNHIWVINNSFAQMQLILEVWR